MADPWDIVEGTSSVVGHDYFHALARSLGGLTDARLVLVLAAGRRTAEVLAAFTPEGAREAPELALHGTPLEGLVGAASFVVVAAPAALGSFALPPGARLVAASAPAAPGRSAVIVVVAGDDGAARVGRRELAPFAARASAEVEALERCVVPRAQGRSSRDAGVDALRARSAALAAAEREAMDPRARVSDRLASVSTLAAGLAHEINNPLTYVLGNLDVALTSLEAAGADAELLDMLREARQGAIRVSEIVRSMRVFARVEPNASKLADVDCVVESALAMAKNEIRHRARLVKRLGAPPIAAAHEATLIEVVLHLLMNAAQAIPEGQVDRDEIGVTTGLDASGRVFIEVRDTGVGMTPDTMRRIFDPFFTTKEVGRGMGLGLSLVHTAVTTSGGDISVASAPGAGSTFRVSLPAAPERAPARASLVAPAGPRSRILIVDDEASVVRLLQRMLVARHDVVVAPSGRDALEILRADDDFDAVLCDVMMPDLTGADVHRAIARESPALAARFVFVTGGAFGERARAHVEATKQPVVTKPFRRSEVLSVVELVARSRRPDAGPPSLETKARAG